MSHSIHPDAEAELGDAAVYYAKHASGFVAAAFLAEYERVRDLLVENQQRGPHGEEGLRVYHFDHFPYTVAPPAGFPTGASPLRFPHEFSGGQRQRIAIARAGGATQADRLRRADLGTGRQRAGADPEPARTVAARTRPILSPCA